MDSKRLEFIEERRGAADFNGVSIWIKLIDLRPNDCLKRSVIQRSGTQDENSEGCLEELYTSIRATESSKSLGRSGKTTRSSLFCLILSGF